MLKDINLIPDRILNNKKYRLLMLLKVSGVIVSVAAIGILLSLAPYRRFMLEKQVKQLSVQIRAADLKDLKELENKVSAAKKELEAFEALLINIPSTDGKTAELLQSVTAKMPSSLKAQEIKYDADSKLLTISYTSNKFDDISLFLKRLHDDTRYSAVNVSEIQNTAGTFRFTIVISKDTAGK